MYVSRCSNCCRADPAAAGRDHWRGDGSGTLIPRRAGRARGVGHLRKYHNANTHSEVVSYRNMKCKEAILCLTSSYSTLRENVKYS